MLISGPIGVRTSVVMRCVASPDASPTTASSSRRAARPFALQAIAPATFVELLANLQEAPNSEVAVKGMPLYPQHTYGGFFRVYHDHAMCTIR